MPVLIALILGSLLMIGVGATAFVTVGVLSAKNTHLSKSTVTKEIYELRPSEEMSRLVESVNKPIEEISNLNSDERYWIATENSYKTKDFDDKNRNLLKSIKREPVIEIPIIQEDI